MGQPMGPVISAQAPPNAAPVALAASATVKAAPGVLYGATVTNTKASAQYIQIHDSATLPADNAVPLMSINLPAHSVATLDCGLRGRAFSAGIIMCNSSTDATKTIGSADCLFDAQYA